MSNKGINFSDARYFDGFGANSGFLTIATSGDSANSGTSVVRLTSCNLSYTNETTDLISFDSDFQIARAITTQSFEISAEGYFTESASANGYTGNTTYVKSGNGYDAIELLDLSIARRTDLRIFIKLGTKVYTGPVIISSFEVASSVGEVQTYSMTLQSNGGLSKVN